MTVGVIIHYSLHVKHKEHNSLSHNTDGVFYKTSNFSPQKRKEGGERRDIERKGRKMKGKEREGKGKEGKAEGLPQTFT